ncbi:hypothetical protein F5880DRAFT_1605900 [Lentinula raphanica]|nr:hypothetical protein F5880DRAFT_1605900 [Lentinula raphanica]
MIIQVQRLCKYIDSDMPSYQLQGFKILAQVLRIPSHKCIKSHPESCPLSSEPALSPHSQPSLPCKLSKKQRRSPETSLHPHRIYYYPNLVVYSFVMTRFTFALILAFLALTVAPAILAAPISVRRSLKDDGLLSRRQPDGSGADGSAGSDPTLEALSAFYNQLESTTNQVTYMNLGNGDVKTKLKNLAKTFGTAADKNLKPPVRAKDEEKIRAANTEFCTNHKSDLQDAESDAETLSKNNDQNAALLAKTAEQYKWLVDQCENKY